MVDYELAAAGTGWACSASAMTLLATQPRIRALSSQPPLLLRFPAVYQCLVSVMAAFRLREVAALAALVVASLAAPAQVKTVALGRDHTCVLLLENGGVRCWGGNSHGQLGVGLPSSPQLRQQHLTQLLSPPTRDVITNIAALSAGHRYNCVVVKGSGGVRCWGTNFSGECGVPVTQPAYRSMLLAPPTADVMTGVAEVVAGHSHACVIMAANRGVRCWGFNMFYQANTTVKNPSQQAFMSVALPSTTDIVTGAERLAVGEDFTCALLREGDALHCWGSNAWGQYGWRSPYHTPPSQPFSLGKLSWMSAGEWFMCGVWGNGSHGLKCWGSNTHHRAGGAVDAPGKPTFITPDAGYLLEGVMMVSAGHSHACAVIAGTGGVRCWGSNVNVQCGVDNVDAVPVPPATDIIRGVAEVVAGYAHTCHHGSQSRAALLGHKQ